MKSIILAAGQGTRLRPLTKTIPKCMIKLFGKSILEWQIEAYRNCGINDISIVTGYLGNIIKFPNIEYFRNEKYLSTNMVETLFCAKEKLTDSVIVSYGDIIFEKQVLENLIDSKDDISVVIDKNWKKYWEVRFKNPLYDAESLVVDEDQFIRNIGQKVQNLDEIQGQFIGLMKFQKNGLEDIKNFYEKFKSQAKNGVNPLNDNLPFGKSFMTDFLQGLVVNGCKLKSVPVNSGWLELDSLDDLQLYEKLYKENKLNFFSIGNNTK